MRLADLAWNQVDTTTIRNCWRNLVSSRMTLTAQKLFHLLRFPSPPSSIHHPLPLILPSVLRMISWTH
jgi:hypothetical protein